MTQTIAETAPQIFQFKVSLGKTRPVWRRIQIPADSNFRELHFAIQSAMGWRNCHLYEFTIRSVFETKIGEVEDGGDVISAKTIKLSSCLPTENKVMYTYDFGIGWDHKVVLEKILPAADGEIYPKCIAGKRACPPEDGVYSDSDEVPDPEVFDPQTVDFDRLDKDPFGNGE